MIALMLGSMYSIKRTSWEKSRKFTDIQIIKINVYYARFFCNSLSMATYIPTRLGDDLRSILLWVYHKPPHLNEASPHFA